MGLAANGLDGEPPILLFDCQASREGKHAANFLQGWEGRLVVGGYAGYKALFRDGSVTELGRMANARRKFFDLAQADGSPAAARALRHIARLYRIEAKAQGCPAEVRERLRAKHAGPKPRLYLAWLFKARAQAPTAAAPPRRSTTRSTAGPLRRDRPPAHRQQPGRERHPPRRRGEKELAVHRLGAGRQTGCGDPELLGTAKLNGLDPAAWLKDTLEKLPAWPNSRIDELLPLKWDQKEG